MMDDLQINDGLKRLTINGDPSRVIEFNPSDVLFAERFYDLMEKFDAKITEYQERSEVLESDKEQDQRNIPVNLKQRIALLKEACEFIRAEIDYLFGVGTSQTVFGDTYNIDVFIQFFERITPLIETIREEKIAKYTRKKNTRKVML